MGFVQYRTSGRPVFLCMFFAEGDFSAQTFAVPSRFLRIIGEGLNITTLDAAGDLGQQVQRGHMLQVDARVARGAKFLLAAGE